MRLRQIYMNDRYNFVKRHSWQLFLSIWMLLVFFSGTAVRAQDYRAKLTVTVEDSTGARLSGAAVSLTRSSTGAVSNGTTDESGVFVFLFLEPDTYTLRASSPGLATYEVKNITLQSYQATGLEVKLNIASTNMSVEVRAEGPVLQTETASRAFNLTSQQVENLPVPNNNPVMLGAEVPGVYLRPLGVYTDPWTVTSQFLINGGLMYLNEFQIDGAPNDAQFGNNTYGYAPPNYAVKEVSVSANNYDAQYGHTSGGVINLSTKSGTEQFHGQGWGFFKRPGWNANSFQNNAIGARRPVNSQDQYGFQVGGPMVIPHLISRKSPVKPFFFVAFDRYLEQLPNALTLSYPSAEMRSGDFSKLTDASGNLITIYDPTQTRLDTNGNTVREAFSGNVIPASRLNPVAKAVAALMPAPNTAISGQRYAQNNFTVPNNFYDWHFYNWLGRLDLDIGDNNKLFIRPYVSKFSELSNNNGIHGTGATGGNFSRFNRGYAIDYIRILNANTTLNLRWSQTLYREQWKSPDNQKADLTSVNLPSSFASQLPQPALFGRWNFQQYASLGWFQTLNDTNTYAIQGSLSKLIRGHNIRVGADTRLTHYHDYNPGYAFTFAFNSDWTRSVWNDSSSEANSGDSFASFLLGTPSGGSAYMNATRNFSSWYIAPWIQDDWKVLPRLTLNFGLRYDLLTPPTEEKNQMNVGFDPSIPNAVANQLPASSVAAYPQLADLRGGLLFAGINGKSRAPITTDWNNVQPRIGFAFLAHPKLVFRGGYGLFFTNFQSNDIMQDLGFSRTTSETVSSDGGITPVSNGLSNPFPAGVLQPSGSSLGTLTYLGQGFNAWNRWYKIPRAHEFSFGFQYRVGGNGVFEMAYVGNRVRAYAGNVNVNLPNWSFAQQCDALSGGKMSVCNQLVSNPFFGVSAFQGSSRYTSTTISNFEMHRPHPQFGDVTEEGRNIGKDWYNGLQVAYSHRASHGLMFNTSYVWSKQIEQWGWMNQYLNKPQRSPYYLGLPQVFKLSATYELPVGRDKALSLGGNRLLDAAFGGWLVASDFTAQSGEPAALPSNAYPLHDSTIKKVRWGDYKVRGWGNCVLSTDANGKVAPLQYSLNAGCGDDYSKYDWMAIQTLNGQQVSPSNSSTLRMKPMIVSNMALQKTFKIERYSIEFRAQATNWLNHFNLLTSRFNTNPYDANFGTVFPSLASSLDSPPRVLQLGVRGSF